MCDRKLVVFDHRMKVVNTIITTSLYEKEIKMPIMKSERRKTVSGTGELTF